MDGSPTCDVEKKVVVFYMKEVGNSQGGLTEATLVIVLSFTKLLSCFKFIKSSTFVKV